MNITTNDSDFERHNFFVNLVRIPLFWFFDFLPTSILNKLFVAFGGVATQKLLFAFFSLGVVLQHLV